MNIELSGDTARVIQAALASGSFASAEEVIAAMANDWRLRHPLRVPSSGDENAVSAQEGFAALNVIGCMKPAASDLATNPEHMEGFGR